MIVTLEAYDDVAEVFETRLERSKEMLKVPLEKLRILQDGEVGKDPRDNMMLLPGEDIRLEDGQCYRKTRDRPDGVPGYWRKCRADGYFFREKAVRPKDMMISMWHKLKNEKNIIKRYAAILELDKIHTANKKLLEDAKAPDVKERIEAEDLDYQN